MWTYSMWRRERTTGMEVLIATDPPGFSHLKTSHHLVCFWFYEVNQEKYRGVLQVFHLSRNFWNILEILSTGFHTGQRLSRYLNPLDPHSCRIRNLNGIQYSERRSKHSFNLWFKVCWGIPSVWHFYIVKQTNFWIPCSLFSTSSYLNVQYARIGHL